MRSCPILWVFVQRNRESEQGNISVETAKNQLDNESNYHVTCLLPVTSKLNEYDYYNSYVIKYLLYNHNITIILTMLNWILHWWCWWFCYRIIVIAFLAHSKKSRQFLQQKCNKWMILAAPKVFKITPLESNCTRTARSHPFFSSHYRSEFI